MDNFGEFWKFKHYFQILPLGFLSTTSLLLRGDPPKPIHPSQAHDPLLHLVILFWNDCLGSFAINCSIHLPIHDITCHPWMSPSPTPHGQCPPWGLILVVYSWCSHVSIAPHMWQLHQFLISPHAHQNPPSKGHANSPTGLGFGVFPLTPQGGSFPLDLQSPRWRLRSKIED